ncbi:MAG: DUF6128 domain-containing protein [Lachnospiraceae bacterium]|nr:DUF6128 domain-containing protein [Lachnospiraceae bacterium]
MMDYHRILSYLYRYDKNDKKECRGFVKAEQKRSGLKLTIQIADDRLMEDMNLDLCFYQKQENGWKMWRLDQLSSGNHQEEIVVFYPTERLPEGFDIRQQYGILFLYQDSFFYGSVWIGDGIPVAQLMENDHSKEEFVKEEPEQERKEEIPIVEPVLEDQEESMEAILLEEIEKNVLENDFDENPFQKEEERELEEDIIREEKERSPEEEIIQEEKEREPEGDIIQEENERKSKEEISTINEDLLTKMWIDTEKKAQPVDNIFNRAFRRGYQISVEQLARFSPEAGKMAENQFLLKGYHRYQHLLAGKVMYAGQERYCIGVPGIYENRERYMAEIYQFPIFLSLTENRIKTGGFGYWLHLLQE